MTISNFDPKQITEGWINLFLDKINFLSPEIKKIGSERIAICMACPVRTQNRCDNQKSHINTQGKIFYGCGCDMSAKTLSLSSRCPGGFW